jgi:DUF971 family protein
MNRRLFMLSALATGTAMSLRRAEAAVSKPAATKEASCIMKLDEISTEATGYTRYEHHHQLAIPVSALILPPKDGLTVRTTNLDQGSLDVKAFEQFIKESGLDPALRHHSHAVSFTREELDRIAVGEKEVKISVKTPKGNFAHEFFFTAPQSALIKVRRGRQGEKFSSAVSCLVRESEVFAENHDTPFYEHFHTLSIPVKALIEQPASGVVVTTTEVDQNSYDVAGFAAFIKSSKLNPASLKAHTHAVSITQNQLQRIAAGEKDVEIKVISKAGNYVHNFLVTAPRSAILKIQKAKKV